MFGGGGSSLSPSNEREGASALYVRERGGDSSEIYGKLGKDSGEGLSVQMEHVWSKRSRED